MREGSANDHEVALGLALASARAGAAAGRAALSPPASRNVHRCQVRYPAAFARTSRPTGAGAESWARARFERLAGAILAAPEVERAVDRLLAGQLTDAVARSVAEHGVAERVATQIVATTDFDRVVASVLDNELTERAVERALESPGLERLVVRVLDSRFVDGLTERVLHSPEMDRVVEYIATSPQLLEAVSQHTETLAEEMVADVRRRTHSVDDFAERTVRGWLRRPRPSPS